MKKIIVMMLMAVICHATSFSQKITTDKVPAAVTAAMKAKFPAATQQSWEMETLNVYEVAFFNGKKKQSATFDKTGKWMETETEISYSALPRPVSQAVSKQFGDFKLQEVSEIETADKGLIYEVVVVKGKENYEVQYSPKGEVLKKEAGKAED